MTNAHTLFRSLIIYAICLPLAIYLGYLLANPLDSMTFITIGLLAVLLMFPILLKFHYPWLLFCWNTTAGLYFLPGKPGLAVVMTVVSLGISVLSYIMNRNLKFITVRSVSWPLLCLIAVVLATAKLTGGIGLNMLGSSSIGGKRYLFLISGILSFFAITAQRIPANKADQYINLYFLGALSGIIGQVASLIGPSVSVIFLMFPVDLSVIGGGLDGANPGVMRLSGLAITSIAVMAWMLARYGLKGVLATSKHWRTVVFVGCFVACLFGGFRSMLLMNLVTCAILFYMEGLTKSRLMPVLLIVGVFMIVSVIPFVNKMPLSVQRSLAFLPLQIDPEAELSAKESTQWRLDMWNEVLPTVPRYLILGKGYGIDSADFDMMSRGLGRGEIGAAGSELAGDYHNGPLSLIIPFGIFGTAAFLWFLVAGLRVLHRNYRYGDPTYLTLNRFLLTNYIVKIISFFFVFGSFHSDMLFFIGPVGLSIALHGGVRGPVVEPVMNRPVFKRFKLAESAQ
jgi:hypothetical protein